MRVRVLVRSAHCRHTTNRSLKDAFPPKLINKYVSLAARCARKNTPIGDLLQSGNNPNNRTQHSDPIV